ncbi:hypothetical protein [Olleya aquimaris]|uniref:Uncharacterized protein n=1 Tax=Olleya aquimaris TaxID=639310 RepID=A0A327RD81_9FLAO|nr:hypothetical protein [Olleya aquimaris]RAJ14966.1 hypothetical protein LY08_01314 [Olleya aquimaris]
MSEKLITIKSVNLNNHCPECFSKTGLQITFKQRFVETAFYKSITKDVDTEMHCTVCNTKIYPSQWTDDIERVYDYQMKAFQPKKASKKYKGLFWIILVATVAITASVIGITIYKL